jgi:hypothetical protein
VLGANNSTLITQVISVFAPGNGNQYVPQSLVFTANSATTTVRFRDVSQSTFNVDLLLDNVVVTLQDAPVITGQPEDASAPIGGNASFTVTATGQNLSYQWRHDGNPIGGATGSTYTIDPVQNSDAGDYDVVVSNTFGSVTSATATLTIVPAGGLTNGSFESDYAGWTVSGNQAIVSGEPFQATDGAKLVAFNVGQHTPNGVLAQSIATIAGHTYVLTFDLGAFSAANQDEQKMEVTVQGDNLLNSEELSVFAPGNGNQYLPQSINFVADSNTTTITFRDISQTTTNVDLLLDNVQVTEQ